MNLIQKHTVAIKILEAIETFVDRIQHEEDVNRKSIFCDMAKSKHKVEIYYKCITRLTERYEKLKAF